MKAAPRLSLRSLAKLSALATASVLCLGAAPPASAPIPAAPQPASQPAAQTPPTPAAAPAKTAASAVKPTSTPFTVAIDQTQTLQLDRPISTLSIGNPSIADVNIQNGNRIFVLGKSFGRTNVLALDSTGETILDMTVFVTAPSGNSVTVYKGGRQLSYNCTPKCERTLMPGDAKDEFEALSNQFNQKASMGGSNHE